MSMEVKINYVKVMLPMVSYANLLRIHAIVHYYTIIHNIIFCFLPNKFFSIKMFFSTPKISHKSIAKSNALKHLESFHIINKKTLNSRIVKKIQKVDDNQLLHYKFLTHPRIAQFIGVCI